MTYMGLTQKRTCLGEKTLQNVAFVIFLRRYRVAERVLQRYYSGPAEYSLVKERWLARARGRKKSRPSTIRVSVARFWGTERVFLVNCGEKKFFTDYFDVTWITDGRPERVGGER